MNVFVNSKYYSLVSPMLSIIYLLPIFPSSSCVLFLLFFKEQHDLVMEMYPHAILFIISICLFHVSICFLSPDKIDIQTKALLSTALRSDQICLYHLKRLLNLHLSSNPFLL